MDSASRKQRKTQNRVGLLLADKVKILHDLENGSSVSDVMKKYKVRSASTIYCIKYAKDSIYKKVGQQVGMSKRKRFKNPRYPLVDEALYIWFLQKRQNNRPVSQEMLQVQAKKFFNQMVRDGEFGSRGYVEKFIKRNGIRLLKISGEKLSSNVSIVESYRKDFAAQIRENDLSPCQIFNADESGLFFKKTPTRTFVDRDAKTAPGYKINKERVTFMPCCNMDGTLKLPLMLIGKSHKPRALKNLKDLPVYYKASKSAWMDKVLFKEWFFEEFVPKVTAHLKSKGLPVRAALVLDNCSAHYNADALKTADGSIFTIFLPANTTAILQPMDQNIIQMIKTRYRNLMMQEVQARGGEFDETVKKINIKDVIFWVAQAWELVPADSIRKSWNLLYNANEIEDEDDVPLSVVRDMLRSIAEKIEQSEEIDEEDAEFQTLNDDEIIASVVQQDEDENITSAGDDTMQSASMQEEASQSASFGDDDEHVDVTDEAALNGFDLVIRYAEENHWPLTTQFSLRQMRTNVMDTIVNKQN